MTSGIRYFIGNWKMFGIPSSYKILDKINGHFNKDKKNNKKYKIIIAPPFTLLQDFSKRFKNKNISISAQNCYHKDIFGSYTGYISPFMIKKLGINYVIIGHSENRSSGDTNRIINLKIKSALKKKLKVIFCIGETLKEKRKNKTNSVLNSQIVRGLKNIKKNNNIIFAYEPVWSIGTGLVPKNNDLKMQINVIKKVLSKFWRLNNPKIIYGGSVNPKNINDLRKISSIKGFLVGGASQKAKNFIDIIKKTIN